MSRNRRAMVAIALGMAGVLGTSSVASAQVNLQGTATGCFYTGATAPTTAAGCNVGTTVGSAGNSLVYQGSMFNVTSNPADGLFTLGTNQGPGNTLGTLTLTGGQNNYTGYMFALFLNFTAPSGADQGEYYATLTGNLQGASSGNVNINFAEGGTQFFNFSNGTVASFSVNDVSINNQFTPGMIANVDISGQGNVNAVPEPASVVLMATGLLGVIGFARRRSRKA